MLSPRILSISLLLLTMTACASSEQAPPPTAPPAPTPASSREAVVGRMQKHYARGDAVRTALIAGDLPGAKEAGRRLSTTSAPRSMPAGSAPYYAKMQVIAGALAEAPTLEEAALGLGALAVSCGACHSALGKGPVYVKAQPPERLPGVKAHMLRHAWATDRMWQALVDPSNDAWDQAMGALAAANLEEEELALGQHLPAAAQALDGRLHEFAASGRLAASEAEMGVILGHSLTLCAACHEVMKAGPRGKVAVPTSDPPTGIK